MRYLSDRGGPDKRKAYWEEKIHGVLERGEPCLRGISGGRGSKKRVLHKKLLLPYEFLPVTQEQNSQAGNRTWSTAKISVKGNRVSEISNDSKNDYSKIPTS